jgi:RecB family exonuclease
VSGCWKVIDLIYRDDEGLVIVDYKTDTVPAVALDRRVAFYRPQMGAYAAALQAATQEAVTRCVLVFLSPGGAVERTVEGIKEATALVRDAMRSELTRGRSPREDFGELTTL